MKKIFLITFSSILFSTLMFAQSVGINNTTPHASAILDIKSNNKGVLLPRTSTTSRVAITNPAKGLILYDTTTSGFWFHNGSAWSQLSAGSIGWNLIGNAGTNPASNFVGTTDNQPLRFRVNNTWAGEIHPSNGNVFFGLGAGQSNTSGFFNTATGNSALLTNNTGRFNTANGYEALYSNTTGDQNTAYGFRALYFNTTGFSNTATGANALLSNTTGNFNTANGDAALFHNTTASGNTAIGDNAISAQSFDNGGTGWVSGNTAVGNDALSANEPTSTANGINNTAVGNLALTANTTGYDNTGVGTTALYTNTLGYENTATGRQSLFYNTTGHDNTATGYKALRNTNVGNQNSANGVYALYSNTTGTANTASGASALYSNTTGDNNTALGYFADVSTGNLNGATAIGSGAFVDASYKVRIGNTVVTSIGGQVGWSNFSDGRYKKNIKEDVKGLSFINSLHPITYTVDINALNEHYDKGRKHDSAYEKAKASMKPSADEGAKIVYNGFIAQDVEKAAQSIGYNFSGVDKPQTKDGLYGLRYSDFVVPLVKAMQEQQVMIEKLTKQIEQREKPAMLEKQQLVIEDLKIQIAEMKNEIELLKKKN